MSDPRESPVEVETVTTPDDDRAEAAAAWDAALADPVADVEPEPAPTPPTLADRAGSQAAWEAARGGSITPAPRARAEDRGGWALAREPAHPDERPGVAWLREYLARRAEAHVIVGRLNAVPLGQLLSGEHDDDLVRLAELKPTHEVRGDVEPWQREQRELENRLGSVINPLVHNSGLVRDPLGYAVPSAMLLEVPR